MNQNSEENNNRNSDDTGDIQNSTDTGIVDVNTIMQLLEIQTHERENRVLFLDRDTDEDLPLVEHLVFNHRIQMQSREDQALLLAVIEKEEKTE